MSAGRAEGKGKGVARLEEQSQSLQHWEQPGIMAHGEWLWAQKGTISWIAHVPTSRHLAHQRAQE